MSRCFPFVRPGYIQIIVRDDPYVFEAIKRAEEKVNKRERRKERKEKKRKDREEKESESYKRRRVEEVDGQNHTGTEYDQTQIGSKDDQTQTASKDGQTPNGNQKVNNNVQNQKGDKCSQNQKDGLDKLDLEKSSLTIEERKLLQPKSLNLRKNNEVPKYHQPLNGRHKNDSKNVPRPKRMMTTTKKDEQNQLSPSRKRKLDSSQTATKEQSCSTSAPEEASNLRKKKRNFKLSSRLCSICPPSMAVKYMNLVENWVPNEIKRELELTNFEEDEDCWWAKKKPTSSHKESCEQHNKNDETKEVTSSSSSWPRARLLQEADIYALPYTVPF